LKREEEGGDVVGILYTHTGGVLCIFANQLWPERRQTHSTAAVGLLPRLPTPFLGSCSSSSFFFILLFLLIFFQEKDLNEKKKTGGQKAVAFGYIIISSPFFFFCFFFPERSQCPGEEDNFGAIPSPA
jgi:hypothetical protein